MRSVQGKTVAIPDPNPDPERLKKAVHIVLVCSGRVQILANDQSVQMMIPAGNFAPLIHNDPIAVIAPDRTRFYSVPECVNYKYLHLLFMSL